MISPRKGEHKLGFIVSKNLTITREYVTTYKPKYEWIAVSRRYLFP